MTLRTLASLLKNNKLTVREMAEQMKIPPEEVLVQIGFLAQKNCLLKMVLPKCRTCGFIFRDRKKGKPPSRCPKCRGEGIEPPKYHID